MLKGKWQLISDNNLPYWYVFNDNRMTIIIGTMVIEYEIISYENQVIRIKDGKKIIECGLIIKNNLMMISSGEDEHLCFRKVF